MSLDKELLSAYYDDEVPEQFHERIETMLDDDDTAILDEYSDISKNMKDIPYPDFSASKARVFEKIQMEINRPKKTPFWKKRITLPMPLVAAAAALFFVMPFAFNTGSPAPSEVQYLTDQGQPQVRLSVDMKDIEDVLRVLKMEEERSVQFELPVDNFDTMGDPRFLRAVDFQPITEAQ